MFDYIHRTYCLEEKSLYILTNEQRQILNIFIISAENHQPDKNKDTNKMGEKKDINK